MPVEENLLKQEISYAYAAHVISAAGFISTRPQMDVDSIDFSVKASGPVDGTSIVHGVSIDLQLKTSINLDLRADGFIYYNLKIKNYKDLRDARVAAPKFLVILYLSNLRNNWIDVDHDRLLSRRAAYWCSLRNAPGSKNTMSQLIRIPHSNLFTPDALQNLMAGASREETLDYAG